MKRILITGANSYIGTSFEKWLGKDSDKYIVDTIDMRTDTWKEKDFSKVDVIFHVAGIAHIKETKHKQEIYYKVNRDLTYETAKKAKEAGVKHFVFLSSMSVYGIEEGVIDETTPVRPKSAYGKSKAEAEELIGGLKDESFTVSIIRPPMVYGKNCKGNYPRLARLALGVPIFPEMDNKRSMIYIDNLSEFVKLLIDNGSGGVFYPQNAEYVNTTELVQLIAKAHGKKIITTKLFNPFLRLVNVSTVKKVFGDLVYDMRISRYMANYIVCNFGESIKKTEG